MIKEPTTKLKFQIDGVDIEFLTRFFEGAPKTFSSIFKGETYPALKIFSPSTIIDVGANIGATSIFFSIILIEKSKNLKKKIKILFKLNNYFAKISLKNNSKKYTSAFACSFFIGFFIATIPSIYKHIENFRNVILVKEQRKIQIKNKTAYIYGPTKLIGAEVMATDLRASVSLVLAGLISDNRTILNRIYHLDRGYESLEAKLKRCKADIKRTKYES